MFQTRVLFGYVETRLVLLWYSSYSWDWFAEACMDETAVDPSQLADINTHTQGCCALDSFSYPYDFFSCSSFCTRRFFLLAFLCLFCFSDERRVANHLSVVSTTEPVVWPLKFGWRNSQHLGHFCFCRSTSDRMRCHRFPPDE